MKIVLAEHFGMCFGVRDAIAQAEDWRSRRRSQFSASSYTTRSCASGFARKAWLRAHSINSGADIRAGDDYRTWSIGRKARSVARARISRCRWNVSSRSARARPIETARRGRLLPRCYRQGRARRGSWTD